MFHYFLLPLFWFLLINLAAFSAGLPFYYRITGRRTFLLTEFIAFPLVLGMMLLGFGMFLLGVLHLLYPILFLLLLSVITAAGVVFLLQNKRFMQIEKGPVEGLSLFFLPVTFLLCYFPVLFVPHHSHDSLVYHLTIPKEYLAHHGITAVPHHFFFNMPHSIEVLYTLPMSWGGTSAVNLISYEMNFLLFAGFLYIAQRSLMPALAPVLAILYVASPLAQGHFATAQIEHQIACFLLFAHIIFLDWWKQPDIRLLFLCSLLGGWIMGCKYTAWFMVIPLQVSLIYALYWHWRHCRLRGRALLGIAAAWILPLLPWLIKSWIITGNPIYPVAYHLFGGVWWDEMREMQFARSFTFKEYYVDPTLIWSVYHFITTLPGVYNFQIIKEELLAGGMLCFWMLALLMPQSWMREGRLLLFWSLAVLLCWRLLPSVQARFLLTVIPLAMLVLFIPLRFAFRFRFLRAVIIIGVIGNLLVKTELPRISTHFMTTKGQEHALQSAPGHKMWRAFEPFLTPESKVFMIFENKTFFSKWECMMDSTYQGPISLMLLREYGSAGLANWLVDQGFTHVLQNYGHADYFYFGTPIYDLYSYTKEKMSREHQQLLQFFEQECEMLHTFEDVHYYKIRPRVYVRQSELATDEEIVFHGAGVEIDLERMIHPTRLSMELSNHTDYELILYQHKTPVCKLLIESSAIETPGVQQISSFPTLKTICFSEEMQEKEINRVRILPSQGQMHFTVRNFRMVQ
jgi:hypothetical protein